MHQLDGDGSHEWQSSNNGQKVFTLQCKIVKKKISNEKGVTHWPLHEDSTNSPHSLKRSAVKYYLLKMLTFRWGENFLQQGVFHSDFVHRKLSI